MRFRVSALTLAIATCCAASATCAELPGRAFDNLGWRLVGPQRAGWGTMATGVADQPETFYFGAAGGGVWKTENAGRTWTPIFDHGPPSIGAIAVAPSDPRTIYVGTGQVTTRYDIAAGEGVFKSTDGGASWQSIGLKDTKHIGAIWVDPHDANVVMVAALGHAFGPNAERGVYRSEDGGRTWTKTLFVSPNTGAVDIAADPVDPNIVFASVWQMRYRPWLAYFTPDTGPESGVYKSVDGGRHWARVSGGGFPGGDLARIGLAVTRKADATRVYAVVDADKVGGLYRSDDAGANWKRVNEDEELVNSYFARLTAVPGQPDAVYSVGRSIHYCTEGGAHCEIVKGSPGGDDYHDLWINPKHPDRMITASDQGTVVTVDGGKTWSSWYNQPTGQFYHLATDNRFPYWIYSGQQDNGRVAIASRSDYGSIGAGDWHPVGAQERDDDIPDPRDPNIVYGSGLGGNLVRWDARNGERQDISPWPVSSYGARPTSVKYHYTWITPIAVSQRPPYPLYQGAQVVFRSIDQGATWETVSPDLSSKVDTKKDCKVDQDAAGARACGYGVVFSLGLSPRNNDTIWVGMDDGAVKLTRDAGRTWADVTPKDLPAWARVSSVDASALDDGTAYIAVDNHRQDDFRPMAWRTHDFGKTWTRIVDGLPEGHFLGALRADPVQRGLLYAGTDQGVYASLDDGAHWASLQRNLPNAIVNDLAVHGDDLIAATQGRAIWVLDDVAPLRELAHGGIANAPAHLFAPAAAIRVRGNQNNDTPLPREEPVGTNPPDGALLDYWLARDARGPVTLTILDAEGRVVRRFASDAVAPKLPSERYFEARWLQPPARLSAKAGMHRFPWNLRMPRPLAASYEFSIAAIDGVDTPLLPQGMLVAPGRYTAVLRVDGTEHRAAFDVRPDPRVALDATGLREGLALSAKVVAALDRHYVASAELQAVRKQVDAAKEKAKGHDASMKALADLDAKLAPLAKGEGEDAIALGAIGGALISLQTDLENTDRAPSQPQREVQASYAARLDRALAAWSAIKANDLPATNAALKAAGLDAIQVPARAQLPVVDAGVSREVP